METAQISKKIRIPREFHNELPPAPLYIPEPDDSDGDLNNDGTPPSETQSSNASSIFQTEHDSYSVLREYTQGKPSITPDQYHTLSEVTDLPYLALDPSSGSSLCQSLQSAFGTAVQKVVTQMREFFEPFHNALIFRLMTWFYQPSITKSIVELNSLVKDVLLAPNFNLNNLIGFDAAKENNLMDTYQDLQTEYPTPFSFNDKWLKGSVKISLLCDGVKFTSKDKVPKFRVKFHYHKITQVIQAAPAEQGAEKFHTFPFKPYWQPSPGEPEE